MTALTGTEPFSHHPSQARPKRGSRAGATISDLDQRLLDAHEQGGADALSRLYQEASDLADAEVCEIRVRLDYIKALAALERSKGTLLEARGLDLGH